MNEPTMHQKTAAIRKLLEDAARTELSPVPLDMPRLLEQHRRRADALRTEAVTLALCEFLDHVDLEAVGSAAAAIAGSLCSSESSEGHRCERPAGHAGMHKGTHHSPVEWVRGRED